MRITCDAWQLRAALDLARGVIPARPATIANSGVLLVVRGSTVQLVGSDGDTALAATAEGRDGRDGQVLLPVRPLQTFLTHLDDGDVTLQFDGDASVAVTPSGGSTYSFRPIDATLQMPAPLRSDPVEVDWSRLADAVAAVRHAVGDDQAVQVLSDGDDLVLHATDRYRVARARLVGGGFGEFSGVMELKSLELAARCDVREVVVSSDRKQLRLSGPSAILSCRTLKMVFPTVEQVLDQSPTSTSAVRVSHIRPHMARLAAVAGGEHLTLSFADGALQLSADNAEVGAGSETAAVEDLDGEVTFHVKPQFLRDALDAQVDDRVQIGWTSSLQPVHVTSAAGPVSVKTVVMPIRIA